MSLATRATFGPIRHGMDALDRGTGYFPHHRGEGPSSFHLEPVNRSHLETDRLLALRDQTVSMAGSNLALAIEPFLQHLPGQSDQGYQIARSDPAQVDLPLHLLHAFDRGQDPRFWAGQQMGYQGEEPDHPGDRVIRRPDRDMDYDI